MCERETVSRYLLATPYGLFAISAILWCLLFPIAKAPSNIGAVVTTVAAICVLALLPSKTVQQLYSRTLIACSLLLLMPLLWYLHPGPGNYGAYAKDSLFCLYMLAMAYWSRKYPERLKMAIYALLFGTVLTAVCSLLQYSGVIPMKEPGVALGLHNGTLTGAFSLLLVFGCAVLSYLFKEAAGRRLKLLLFAAIALCLIDLVLVVPGRTGYLAFLALGAFIGYNLYKGSRLLAVSFLVGLVLLIMGSGLFWQRVAAGRADIAQYSSGTTAATSLGARFEMWKVSWRNFTEHPLFGAGTNGFGKRWMDEGYQKVPYTFNNPHSSYFHILGNYGLAGFCILLYCIWRLAVTAWTNRTSLAGVVTGCFLVTFLVGSLTNTMLTSDFYLTWLAIIAGIAGGLPGHPNSSPKGVQSDIVSV